MIPLLLWILSPHFPLQGPHGEQEILASVLFVLASITDGLDGYLARKRQQITTMGMLLDPIADKIMVTGALIALVAYNPQVVKVWIVVVIIAREFLISGLRSIASSEGLHHPGERSGQAQDRGSDCVRSIGSFGPSLGRVDIIWGRRDSRQMGRDCGNLLHRSGVHHFGHRLLCRLLEAD